MGGLTVVMSRPSGGLGMGTASGSSLQGGSSLGLQGSSPNLQPTASPVGAILTSGTPSYGTVSGGGGGVTSSSNTGSVAIPVVSHPGLNSFLNATNFNMGQLQQQYAAIPGLQAGGEADIANVYGDQARSLGTQLHQGQAANTASQLKLNKSNSQSLAQLGEQLHALYQQTLDSLGAHGAGNSSAAQELSLGLGQEANAGRQNIATQDQEQQTGLNLNSADILKNYQDQMASLEAAKHQALTNIADQYLAQRNSIKNSIGSIGSNQTEMTMFMQDQAAAKAALAHMEQVVNSYSTAQQAVQQGIDAATASMSQPVTLPSSYALQAVVNPGLNGISYGANSAPTGSVSTAPVAAIPANTGTRLPGTVQSLSTP